MKKIVFDKDRIGPWVCSKTGGVFSPVDSETIGLEEDGELVAGVIYDHYNGASIAMHVASESKNWMTKSYLKKCFDYPFVQLKVKKVLGLVPSTNENARKFDEHLGFEFEHRIKDAVPFGDLLIYSMTAEKCRWIGK